MAPPPHVFRFGFSHRSTKTDNGELIHPQRRSYIERITLPHYLPIFIYSHDTPLNSPTVVRHKLRSGLLRLGGGGVGGFDRSLFSRGFESWPRNY